MISPDMNVEVNPLNLTEEYMPTLSDLKSVPIDPIKNGNYHLLNDLQSFIEDQNNPLLDRIEALRYFDHNVLGCTYLDPAYYDEAYLNDFLDHLKTIQLRKEQLCKRIDSILALYC